MDPAQTKPSERLALASLVAGAIGIAFAAIFVKWSLRGGVGPVATAVYRMAFALPFLAILAARERVRFPSSPSPWRRAHLLGLLASGLFFAADLAVWHWSIKFTTVTNATLFANFAPIFVAIVAWKWLGERIGLGFVVGLLVSIAGAAVLLNASLHLGGKELKGDLLGIATAVFYAGYQLTVKRLRATLGTFSFMAASTFASSIALAIVGVAEGDSFLPTDPRAWWALVGLAVVSQVLGQSFIAYGVAHLPASFSSVTLLVQPVAAACLAWVLLGERLGPTQILGGAVVLTGILIVRRAMRA